MAETRVRPADEVSWRARAGKCPDSVEGRGLSVDGLGPEASLWSSTLSL